MSKASFSFSKENKLKIKEIFKKYPKGREQSAILPLLDLAQRQSGGWLPREAIEHVSEALSIPPVKGYEIASFYTMFNLKPTGRYHLQICRTTPCALGGSENIKAICEKKLGIKAGQTDDAGRFTISEVECLGACINAPVVQINDYYYENLDEKKLIKILEDLKNEDH